MRREDIDALLATMNGLSEEAQQLVIRALRATPATADPAQVRDELITLTQAIAGRYGGAAAAAAADWYEAMRALETGKEDYRVQLPAAIPHEAVEAKVRAAAGPLWEENGTEQVSTALAGMLDRIVKSAGRDTITDAAEKDPARPRFARVPSGSETCAFCRMLASRGFDYASEKAAGADHKFHDHCDCMIVPAWGKKTPKIKGYNPAADYRRYQTARQAAAKEAGGEIGLTDWDIVSQMEKIYPGIYPAHGEPKENSRTAPQSWHALAEPAKQGTVDRSAAKHVYQHELDTAEKLAKYGMSTVFIPPAETDATPDATLEGERWEFKKLKGASLSGIQGQIRKARTQAGKIVLDASDSPLSREEITAKVDATIKRYNEDVREGRHHIDEVIVLLPNTEAITRGY